MPHRAPVALAFALAMALQGCGKRESEYEQAKARYDFLKAHRATAAELCEEGKKVVAAAADDDNTYDLGNSHRTGNSRSTEH